MLRTSGSYLLLLELNEPVELAVGRMGMFLLPPGWYIYVGSAMGGLEQRVARHQRPSSVRRWHIDYLRAVTPVMEVRLFPSTQRCECDLARAVLALPGADVPVPRFGASDCRCRAHLSHFTARPPLEEISLPRGRP